jgi:hypothetical protein
MMKEKQIFSRHFVELNGCIHNHSEYSFDCEISVKKIIAVAKQKGLDYITINDHRSVSAGSDEAVQNEPDLLILAGMEMNDPTNNNHLLVFGSEVVFKGKSAEEYAKFYMENGAVTFIAHPFENRRTNEFRKYIWTDKENTWFHGLEIWNAVSEWLGSLAPKKNGFFQVFFPGFFIKKANPQALQYWDELAASGVRKAAVGSVDAHTIKHNWHGIKLTFLSHGKLFQTLRTNVLLENKQKPDANDVLQALKNGNSYIINYKLGNPYQFYAGICDSDGNGVIFGEEIKWEKELRFFYRLPKIAKVALIQNGKAIAVQRDEKGFFPIPSSGVYRLEISRWGRGWIYTNHIYVTEKK